MGPFSGAAWSRFLQCVFTMSPISVYREPASIRPTRCPACRGAVIQRLPGRTGGTSTWVYCFFCNRTWKCRFDDVRVSPDGELTGDVFVVTKGGRRRSLGSVVLNAIPEKALKKHLERKMERGERESRTLPREIDAVAAILEKTRAEEDRLWRIQKADDNNVQKAKAWSVVYNKMKTITKQLEDLQTQRQRLITGQHFFQGLPSPISSATTLADGTFTLAIPRDGRYGIVARASGALREDKQTCFWFVWVGLDGNPSKRLVLNNDNMVGAGSPDSALR